MVKINFNELVPNTYNPRKLFRGATMEELRKSIKQVGLIEPLVVRKLNGKYEVVCGMRRYYALKDLKTKEVECNVKELNGEQAKLVALIENIQRENLNPMEEARAYALNLGIDYTDSVLIHTLFGSENSETKGITEFARRIGKKRDTIYRRLRLLTLPDNIQSTIEKKDIDITKADEIARLRKIKKEDLRHRLMENVFDEYMERQDSMSLDDINQRIEKVLEEHKEEEEKEEKEIEDQIDSLRNKIIETKEARNIILDKIRNTLTSSYKKLKNITVKNIENIESIKIPEKDIEIIKEIKTIEDIKPLDFSDEHKAYLVLEFLSKAKEKYADNREYESIVSRINIIGNKISDALLLLERSKKENIIICPYCHARIDTEIIKRDIENYREELEPLKNKRSNIAGMEREIITIEKDLIRFLNGIDSKDGFIEKFNKEIKDLGGK